MDTGTMEVNEHYVSYVRQLDRKLQFSATPQAKRAACHKSVAHELDLLKQKATEKIRDFLLEQVRR